ncbi:HEAT repeat domain-containing protein [Gottfriedia acidiceleris]|uniref:HEAT repeat domain-containing protein n=1 Tax=Gottfriedia acidiceleris TaxID=371036 RepID=UPI003D249A2B
MNINDAVKILNKYNPMPADDQLTQKIVDEYGVAIDYLKLNPHPSCIEPILKSFGEYDGWGLYEEASLILTKFDINHVLPYLITALQSPHNGIRYWATHIVSDFADKQLLQFLEVCIQDKIPDISENSATALGFIGGSQALKVLVDALKTESDPIVIEAIEEAIQEI